MSSTYNLGYNKDDVVVRSLIIGLLADLNEKLFLHRRIDGERKRFPIPFYFSLSTSQNFLYDHFLFDDGKLTHFICDSECEDKTLAQGHYESTPRGVIMLNGMSVDSQALTNKFIRGFYSKINDGQLLDYNAEIHMIPMVFNIGVRITTDNLTENLKVTESIIRQLYKMHRFSVETGDLDESIYRLDAKYILDFEIELKSFIPSINYDTELFSGTRMQSIFGNVGFDSQFEYGGTSEIESIFKRVGTGPFDPCTGKLIIQDFEELRFRRL